MSKPQYVKDKTGRFQGSIGSGKTKTPTVKPRPANPQPLPAGTKTRPVNLLHEVSNATLEDKERWSRHKNSSPQRLAILADDESVLIRSDVARHPKTPESALMRLTRDEHVYIRQQLAFNSNLPLAVEETLAADENPVVRNAVASSPTTRPETLLAVAGNPEQLEHTRTCAVDNPGFPSTRLFDFENDTNPYIRELVAMRLPRGEQTPHTLARMAGDDVWQVRYHVAGNPNTTVRTLNFLAADENETVAKRARQALGWW